MRLSEMTGRSVVDMDAAEKLGEIEDTVLDPEGCRVAGFIVSHGSTLLGGGNRLAFSAASVHSVGPDAVTVHGATLEHAEGAFEGLPRRRDIVGRKIVGHSGKMYGHIHDVLIDGANGQVIGYTVDDSPLRGLDGIFGSPKSAEVEYVKADADLRVGAEIVVVPDEAIVRAKTGTEELDVYGTPRAGTWQTTAAAHNATPSVWVDQRIQPTVSPASVPMAAEPAAAVQPAYEELAFGTAPLGQARDGDTLS